MLNRVVLIGRLTREVDLRFTSNSIAVGTFTLAVNRNFQSKDGQREADFINCVIWRKSAENFANFTRKGSLVGVEGRIQTRNYENQQGQRVYVTEVVVDNFALLESRSVTEQRPVGDTSSTNMPNNYQSNSFDSNNSFNNNQSSDFSASSKSDQSFTDPFAGSDLIDISDDDLPF
ncbi:single-stranded DNA-binding protein [Atopobacter phocae]|uniref:single-stranded DNA-binding protein n=1 Tax=Atopobacter phocae TaxID=136492 RepID=UPI00046FC70B|nr:single-stranded DNA-binding protein [Atopobacter phocae]